MTVPRRHVLVTLWILLAGLVAVAAAQRPVVDFPRDPDFLVVRYTHVQEMPGVDDNAVRVLVWGDGRVELHFPFFLRRSGDYELYLGRAELEGLVSELAAHGMADFDPERVRDRLAQAERSRKEREGTEVRVHGLDDIEIEIGLSRYVPRGGGSPVEVLRHRFSWRNLRAEARLYPEVAELQGLLAAEEALVALTRRGDLIRKTDGHRLGLSSPWSSPDGGEE